MIAARIQLGTSRIRGKLAGEGEGEPMLNVRRMSFQRSKSDHVPSLCSIAAALTAKTKTTGIVVNNARDRQLRARLIGFGTQSNVANSGTADDVGVPPVTSMRISRPCLLLRVW